MSMEAYDPELLSELKELIVKVANLEHVKPNEIGDHDELFRTGLGLDSIDVLELVVSLERKYGVKFRNDESGKKALTSVSALASSIAAHRSAPPQ